MKPRQTKTGTEAKVARALASPHNSDETFRNVSRQLLQGFTELSVNPSAVDTGDVTMVEREIIETLQDVRNIRSRGVPYEEIKDLCTLALDVCQILIERQIQDRKTLPEWQELERKTTERMGEILKDPRFIHLYRDFPGGN